MIPVAAASVAPAGESAELVTCSLGDIVKYFLRLGTFGFGGPIALAGYMQRDLVEQRRWISKQDYVEGLALAQLAPGPLAAQLAIYLGWVRGGTWGATLVGVAFVLPSFFMVLALSALYIHFNGLSWMRGAFYGIGAAVIAIIARSAFKLVKMTLSKDYLLWTLFFASAIVTAWTESEMLWLFLASGVLTLLIKAPPKLVRTSSLALLPLPVWAIAGLAGPASAATLWTIGWYFAEAGAFVFGSGLAIVPFLRVGVVENFHWLNDQQFLDAVAVAMITPGPVVITVAFIGYLVAGLAGASVAALATFLPCYLLTILPAPYFRRFAQNRSLKAFVDGVTAAATGAIAGAAVVLGKRALVDVPTILICLATLGVIIRFKKVPEPLVILTAGALGLLVSQGTGLAPAPTREVVVYTSVDQVFSEPIFRAFEAKTGVRLRAVYDTEETKSTGVLNRIIAERQSPQADVFWSGDPVRPFQLVSRGLVERYVSTEAAGLPESARAVDGTWTGFAARARVLLVNRSRVPAAEAPRSIRDLANPRWRGQAAIANPLFGTTTMHMAALFSVWGEAQTRAFLAELRNNGVRIASSNGEVKRLVVSGEVAFGLTDTDDAHEAQQQGANVDVVYPDQDELGTLIMPTSVVLLRGAPHADAGRRLVDYLLTAEVERQMAQRAAHLPLRAGVEAPANARLSAGLRPMRVDYARVAAQIDAQKAWLRAWVGL